MTAVAPSPIEVLHADLEALKNAIDAEDHVKAERIVAAHDRQLRHYIENQGAAATAPALEQLLEQQSALIERMRALRDQAALHLRQERQSNRAANAYQQAGTLT